MKSDSKPGTNSDRLHSDQYAEIITLVGALAHEIKNPLSTISLNMELLAEDFAEAQTPRERRALSKIQVVDHECQRLKRLLDDFLNFFRTRRINLAPADLNEEIEQILEFYAPQAAEKKIEIIRYLDPQLPSVNIDRESMRSALLNLLINAQQAMDGGGQLVIRTRSVGALVALDLIDNGCGMDERTQSQIFDAFYSTKSNGSGLGLPTVRKMIEAHSGTIAVQSEPGHGTQFTILLPALPRLKAAEPPAPAIKLPG